MFEVNKKILIDEITKKSWTLAELAEKANLQKLTVTKIINNGAKANVKTIGKLANALNINGSSLIIG